MAKLSTQKFENDFFNRKNGTVKKITKEEYIKPGYIQTTTITTIYNNDSKLPNQLNFDDNKNKLKLSIPKITSTKSTSSLSPTVSNNSSIKFLPNAKNFSTTTKSTITTSKTKIENLNYQSPYKTKILTTDKSSNINNKNIYNSSYQQYRSPFLNYLNLKPVTSTENFILNKSNNNISPTTTNYLYKPTYSVPTVTAKKDDGIGKYSNRVQSPNSNFVSPKITKPTYDIKLTATPRISVNKIQPLLNIENFNTQLHLNDKNKKLGPGKLYIFNHDEFQNPNNEYREGSKCDVKLLKDTFKKFNVNVQLFENYTVKKIKNQVEKIFKEDMSKNSCIIIAILSHGNRMERIAANDGSYSIHDDILFPILRNKTLEGKPKILIVQACKGDMDMRDLKTDSCQINTKPLIPDEIYKFYSTSEGFVSYRNEKGSIFIKEFCDELNKSGLVKSIRDIMESAIKVIKLRTSGQQIPSMWVNNTEPYIFGDYLKI